MSQAEDSPKIAAARVSSTARHKVEAGNPALAQALASQGARLIADYGSFQLFDAPAAAAALLGGKGRLRDNYNLIQLNASQFDTSQPETQSLRKSVGSFSGKRTHLVQFAGPVQPAWRDEILKTGARIVDYIPQNAYLIYGDSNCIAQVQSLAAKAPHIQWEGPYADEYKIHPGAQPDANGNARMTGDNLFSIQMVDDPDANAATLQLLDGFKREPLKRRNHALQYLNVVGRFSALDLPKIAARPDVLSILPYRIPRKLDERQDQIVAGNLSGTVPSGPGYLAWLEGKGFTQAQFDASGFILDISDSGIDDGTVKPHHFGLFEGGETTNNSRVMYNRLVGAPNPGSTLEGCDGHGNINAHIAGGLDNSPGFPFEDGAGYHYGLGVCPFVRLGSSVVFDPVSFTDPNYTNLETAAYQSGARIANNSWGGNDGVYDSDAQTFDALVRDAQPGVPGNQEMVIVFAAGNDGPSSQSVETPGTAKNVITVGASDGVQPFGAPDGCSTADADAEYANQIPSFSSVGPCNDGRNKPDLVAPGTHISGGAPQAANPKADGTALGCFLTISSSGLGVCGGTNGSRFWPSGQQFYTASSGTSHSTPCVSGACALLRQYFINQGGTPPSPAMTKAFLMNSARYLTGGGADDTLWSESQGMGELDLGVAFDGTARILADELPGEVFTATGQTRVFTGSVVDSTKPFRVTLAWTDAPGSTSASSAANNDLDLTVTINGVTYLGNVFSGAYSTSGGSPDTLNNVESVFLPAGVTGTFTITVTAANLNSVGVPNDANALEQDFALVACNANPIQISSATLAAESCTPTNGVIDPGETVTLNVALQNGGSVNTTNLVATLLATGGINLPGGPVTYGVLEAGGAPLSQPFAFTAGGSCGATITATFALQDGATSLGTITTSFQLGQLVQSPVFADNFDTATAPALPKGWSTTPSGGQKPWVTTNGDVDTPPNAAFCAASTSVGVGDLLSPVIAINGPAAQLAFRQSYYLESSPDGTVGYDGGVLEIQIGNGGFSDILAAGGSFLTGGYTRTIATDEGAGNNPLAGRRAWSGISGPDTTNSYINTVVLLPASAAGQNIQLKWRCGTDSENYFTSHGWWIDTVTVVDGVYACCTGTAATGPELLLPTNGFQTTSPSVLVSGEAIPSLLLTVYDAGISNNSEVVPADGVYSVATTLAYGTNTLTVGQVQNGTNLTDGPTPVILTPTPPVLAAPTNSAPLVAFSEQGVAGAVVSLYDGSAPGGTLVATFTNDSSGDFSGSVSLATGVHSLAASQTINGETSASSAASSVNVVNLAPPAISAPLSGLVTTNPALTIIGTGIAGATVTLYDGAVSIGVNIVSGAGGFTNTLKLGDGEHTLTAVQWVDGVTSPPGAAVLVNMELKPVFVLSPTNQSMFLKGKAAFTGAAMGAAAIKYQWLKNGAKIAGATAATLSLASITSASAAGYTLTASNSYGGAASDIATLTIVPNPFTNLTGSYHGLFSETPARFQSSGLLTLSLTSLGVYTGRILNAGGGCSFSGAFTIDGQAIQSVSRGTGVPPLALAMNLDLTNGTGRILGAVSNASWAAALQADRASYSTASPAPEMGSYTLLFGGGGGGLSSPGGDGYATVSVSAQGMVSLKGFLSDNTSVAPAAVSVSKYGQWPLYIPLYVTRGSLIGWVSFANTNGGSLSGAASWFRTNAYGKLYPAGFTNALSITGSTFSPGNARTPVLASTNLLLTLDGGDLQAALTNALTLLPSGKFVTNGAGVSKLTLSVAPATGVISGGFLDPFTRLSTPVRGVILQQQGVGGGFFLSTNSTGLLHLTN